VTPVGVEKRVSLSGGRACCRRVNKRSLVGKRARGCCSVGFSVDGEGSWFRVERDKFIRASSRMCLDRRYDQSELTVRLVKVAVVRSLWRGRVSC